jgi:hypothetical protein
MHQRTLSVNAQHALLLGVDRLTTISFGLVELVPCIDAPQNHYSGSTMPFDEWWRGLSTTVKTTVFPAILVMLQVTIMRAMLDLSQSSGWAPLSSFGY